MGMKYKEVLNNVLIYVLFALYMYALFRIILLKFGSMDTTFLWQQLKLSLGNPEYIIGRLRNGNLVPFHEISRTIHGISNHGLINLIGNVVIFIPLGIFIGLIAKNKTIFFIIGAFLCSLGLSLCLESAQVLFSIGSFDVDDLILNSSGGVIGFIAYRGYKGSFGTGVLVA